jgi:molybdopterin-guanine dinucleotide biosynthesis protein A
MKISAVLLAGGESRRFGQDKATFVWEGKPLWERQLDILRGLEPDQILISARTDPLWRPSDIPFIPDEAPSRGPISGLAAAFGTMRGSHLLALAIDLPCVTSDLLRSLVSLTDEGRGVIPVADAKEQPLAAIYPGEAAEIFVHRVKEGSDWSLKSAVTDLVSLGLVRLLAVPAFDSHLFKNMNEPAVFSESRSRADESSGSAGC